MTAWSPGVRDTAVEGLARLGYRSSWRSSEYGEVIVSRVKEALHDENPVVRMQSAQAFTLTHRDMSPPERVRTLGTLLRSEPCIDVRSALLSALSNLADEAPQEVDDALRQFASHRDEVGEDDGGAAIQIETIVFLALIHQTPFSLESVNQWAATASQARACPRAIHFFRSYLAPGSPSSAQRYAFEILSKAADACMESLRQARVPPGDSSEGYSDEGEQALEVLDGIASGIYFASGAFDVERGESSAEYDDNLERFAQMATPIILTCAQSNAGPIVHEVVETLLFFAPLDERRTLLSLTEAISPHGHYVYDSMSSASVIPYLQRLLIEHRQLVLFDQDGVAAFRDLLATFASAGDEAALEMAFTFSDVFR